MWFLARMVFWLGVIIALLPSAPSRQEMSASKVGAVDSLAAASAAVSDIRQFCVRQPDACAAGSEAIARFVQKAETGAKLLYQFLNEREGQGRIHEKPG
jgi:2-methylisocitrate lyase-like PEP mutase family enzyme